MNLGPVLDTPAETSLRAFLDKYDPSTKGTPLLDRATRALSLAYVAIARLNLKVEEERHLARVAQFEHEAEVRALTAAQPFRESDLTATINRIVNRLMNVEYGLGWRNSATPDRIQQVERFTQAVRAGLESE